MSTRMLVAILLSLLGCERGRADAPRGDAIGTIGPTTTVTVRHADEPASATPRASREAAEDFVAIPPFPWTTLDYHCQLQSKPGAPEYSLVIGRDSTVVAEKQILLKSSDTRKRTADLTVQQAYALARIWIALDARHVEEPEGNIGGFCRVRLQGPNKIVLVHAHPSSDAHQALGELFRFIHALHDRSKALSSITPITPLDAYSIEW